MFQVIFNLNSFNVDVLNTQVAHALGVKFEGVHTVGNNVTVITNEELTEQENQNLQQLMQDHEQNHQNTLEYALVITSKSQEEDIQFGQQLLNDWMRKNALEGMTVNQSLWVFTRLEEFTIPTDWGQKRIDLFKMFYAGALWTVHYALSNVEPDDMTESYHWLTQERLDWIIQKLEDHLGVNPL